MKKILFLVCCLISAISYGQSDKIVYILPDKIEKAIKEKMDKVREKDSKASFSCMLFKDKEDTYGISLFIKDAAAENDFVEGLLKKSSRVILIDKEKLALIFDYDLKFSSPNLEKIGEFGKREGYVSRSRLLFHGYTMFFDKHGEITKISQD